MDRTTTITARVPIAVVDALDGLLKNPEAGSTGTTRSNVVAKLLENLLIENKEVAYGFLESRLVAQEQLKLERAFKLFNAQDVSETLASIEEYPDKMFAKILLGKGQVENHFVDIFNAAAYLSTQLDRISERLKKCIPPSTVPTSKAKRGKKSASKSSREQTDDASDATT